MWLGGFGPSHQLQYANEVGGMAPGQTTCGWCLKNIHWWNRQVNGVGVTHIILIMKMLLIFVTDIEVVTTAVNIQSKEMTLSKY